MSKNNQAVKKKTFSLDNIFFPIKQWFLCFPQNAANAWKKYYYLLFAGLIPMAIFFLIYLARGIYPFGEGSVLVLDLNGQYVYFFEALRDAVCDGGSLLYSWSRSLGGEFMGIYAYYIASPLSYIVCLFPKGYMQEALLTIFLLKSGICAITMGYYLHNHSDRTNKMVTIGFSVLYALSSYCVVQQHNTMWIDVVMWLPLVIYGVERVVNYGKFGMFCFFLALALASNFYIGYMLCIFVGVYFFYYMLAKWDNHENNPRYESNHFLKSFVRIVSYSLLSIGMAAVIVLCAYYSLQFGKNSFSTPNWEISIKADFFDILYKFLPGSFDTVRPEGLPFLYCGVLPLILAPAFFTSKKFTAKEKIAGGALILFFIASMAISTADLIWHGFQKPNWLNYRYSFMLCFVLIVMAYRTFMSLEKVSRRTTITAAAFVGAFVIILQKFASQFEEGNKYFKVDDYATIILTVACLAIYLGIIAAMRMSKNKTAVASVMLGIICIEVFLNGLSNINDLDKDVTYTKHYKYNEFQTLLRPVTDTINTLDPSFYRMEKTMMRKTNDNMAIDIRGLANSTSTLNKSTIYFLRMMGYGSVSHNSKYLGGTPVNDSILGLKYIISDRDYSNLYGEPVFTGEDYAKHLGITLEELKEQTYSDEYNDISAADINVYYNPYYLSLAFASDDDILDVIMKEHQSYNNSQDSYCVDGFTNPFVRLNALVTAILGEDETVEVFKPAIQNGDPELSGVKVTNSSGHIKYQNTGDTDGTVTYSYTVPQGQELYLYFPAYYTREVKISSPTMPIKDKSTKFGTGDAYRIIDLGACNGTSYKIQVTINNTSDLFYTKPEESFIYYVDMGVLAKAFTKIQQNQMVIDEKYKEDDISGKITTNKSNSLIQTTIPYDEGWQVYVDGKRVEITETLDALIAFRIDNAGEHTIRFKYSPKCFTLGITISIISIIIFIFLVIFSGSIKKLPVIRNLYYVPDNAPQIPENTAVEEAKVETDSNENSESSDTKTE